MDGEQDFIVTLWLGFWGFLGWVWSLFICLLIGGLALLLTEWALGVPMTSKRKKLRRLKIKPGQFKWEERIAGCVGIIVALAAIVLVFVYENTIIPSVAVGAFFLASYTIYSK